MMVVKKSYTICYSKAGIYQYADFRYDINNKLIIHDFRPSYTKIEDIPDINSCTNIQEILKVIKSFSYNNQAKIYLINGLPVNYYNSNLRVGIEKYNLILDNLIKETTKDFFVKELLPLLIKNKIFIGVSTYHRFILIKKYRGSWDNLKNAKLEFLIEYTCSKYLRILGGDTPKLKSEYRNSINGFFNSLCNQISEFIETHEVFNGEASK